MVIYYLLISLLENIKQRFKSQLKLKDIFIIVLLFILFTFDGTFFHDSTLIAHNITFLGIHKITKPTDFIILIITLTRIISILLLNFHLQLFPFLMNQL